MWKVSDAEFARFVAASASELIYSWIAKSPIDLQTAKVIAMARVALSLFVVASAIAARSAAKSIELGSEIACFKQVPFRLRMFRLELKRQSSCMTTFLLVLEQSP